MKLHTKPHGPGPDRRWLGLLFKLVCPFVLAVMSVNCGQHERAQSGSTTNSDTKYEELKAYFARNYESIKNCSSNKCFNGGTCLDNYSGFQCKCQPRFEGRQCEKQTDHCETNPCENNGWCHTEVDSYTCSCSAGFTGQNCSINIDECASGENPCQNGGLCYDEVGGYSCFCPLSYGGKQCQHKLDLCNPNPCQNEASCVLAPNNMNFVCECNSGFTGPLCEFDVDDCSTHWNHTLCHNGGTCIATNGSYTCDCSPLYKGKNCEIFREECTPLPLPAKEPLDNATITVAVAEKPTYLETVTVDCGGVITIPNFPIAATSFLLHYKPSNSTLQRPEQCLWTFHNVHNNQNYAIKIEAMLLCEGFESTGGALSVVEWKFEKEDMVLSHQELKTGTPNYTSNLWNRKLFLSYTSYNNNHNRSNSENSSDISAQHNRSNSENGHGSDIAKEHTPGFVVLINVLETESWFTGSIWAFTTAPESQTYSSYKKYEQLSIAVNPEQQTTAFTVNYLDLDAKKNGSCTYYDTLDVYEISSETGPNRLARLCGTVTAPLSYTSEYPILATFLAFKSTTGKGFQLSWK